MTLVTSQCCGMTSFDLNVFSYYCRLAGHEDGDAYMNIGLGPGVGENCAQCMIGMWRERMKWDWRKVRRSGTVKD